MRRVILILVAVNASLVIFLLGMFYISETYPFHPGHVLFGLQSAAENGRINLTGNPVKRMEMSLELVDRRLADLGLVKQPSKIKLAVNAFDKSLDNALQRLQVIPEAEAETLYTQVKNTLARTDIVVTSLISEINDDSLQQLEDKVLSLQAATTPWEMQQITENYTYVPPAIMAKVIPFLGIDVDHTDFRLTGGHAFLECLDCHLDGQYQETSTSCLSCHDYQEELVLLKEQDYAVFMVKNNSYPQHFSGECSDCHGTANWQPYHFDHAVVWECKSCHAEDLPDNELNQSSGMTQYVGWLRSFDLYNSQTKEHYPGDCSLCHSDTTDWANAEYDHFLYSDESCIGVDQNLDRGVNREVCFQGLACENCHLAENPHSSSFAGSCNQCHQDVEKWKNAVIDHTNLTNCLACHSENRPQEHFSGLCSKCHVTSDWQTLLFEHKPTSDCASCHVSPNRHYGGQCSNCHTLWNWKSSFNHMLSNCNSCHSLTSPHYSGSCANCHNTTGWSNATFNHLGQVLCVECHTAPSPHYVDQCQNCHTTRGWYPVNFNHSGLTSCESCHTAPKKHYPGSCSTCHNTNNWTNVSFTHSSSSTCSTCHKAPSGHWPGECSNCHVISDWSDYTFNHSLGYTDCKACHARPVGHDRGQCSSCHTTTSWTIYTPTPLPTFTPTPTQTDLPTSTPTPTIYPGTATNTPTRTLYPTITNTPTPTIQPTNIPTDTPLPTATNTPEIPLEPSSTPGEQ